MDVPSTSPSGRKPACRTSRNSLTVRSDVKIEPGLPGCSSASRAMASCGTPTLCGSIAVISILSGGAGALQVADRDDLDGGGGPRGSERDDGGTYDHCLGDVVVPAVPTAVAALALVQPQLHVAHHHLRAAVLGAVGTQRVPGPAPHGVYEIGDPGDLLVARPAGTLLHGAPVVVPHAHRDAERERAGHPAGAQQQRELLPGQVGQERLARPHLAAGPD